MTPDYVREKQDRLRQDVLDAAMERHRACDAGRHHSGFDAKLAIACQRFAYHVRQEGLHA